MTPLERLLAAHLAETTAERDAARRELAEVRAVGARELAELQARLDALIAEVKPPKARKAAKGRSSGKGR